MLPFLDKSAQVEVNMIKKWCDLGPSRRRFGRVRRNQAP